MAGPALPRGIVVETHAAVNADIVPTLLDVLFLPSEEAAGSSRVSCWKGSEGCPSETTARPGAYAAGVRARQLSGLATYRGGYKLSWQTKPGLGFYDLSVDPWERTNLAHEFQKRPDAAPREIRELSRDLDRLRAELQSRLDAAEHEPTAPQQELLKGLGYLND